jgi:hypothetical protein
MIAKDTLIEDIVSEHPELVKPLLDYGIVCVKCGEPIWGTLETQAQEKGILNLDVIIADLNQLINR